MIEELETALKAKDEAATKRIIDSIASLNSQEGASALYLAVKYRHKPLVEYLVEKEVDLNTQGLKGLTPLNLSLSTEVADPEIACLLIDAGADFDIKCSRGFSALHRAIIHYKPEVPKVLDAIIKAGWDISGINGAKALRVAVRNNNPYSTKYLLEHGADPELKLPRPDHEKDPYIAPWVVEAHSKNAFDHARALQDPNIRGLLEEFRKTRVSKGSGDRGL